MDPIQVNTFRKNIEDLVTSDNADCIFQDVMLSFVKSSKSDFPNFKIINELLPTQFPVIVAHKPFNKNPVKQSEQSTFFEDSVLREKPVKKHLSQEKDLAGSPLKLQSYADFSAFDTSLFECTTPRSDDIIDAEDIKFGIPIAVARKLTGLYNVSAKSLQNKASVSFLCFCDGNDRKRTACIYTEVVRSEKNDFLGLKSTVVHVVDPVHNNEHLPNINKIDLSRKHVTCKATYDILNDTKEENQLDLKDNYQYKGSLMLEVTWSKQHANTNLIHSPPPEATTTIKASVIPGSIRSAAYMLFHELCVLKSLIEGLKSSQITWVPEDQRKINLLKSVKELFENLKLGDAYLKNQEKPTKGEGDIGDVVAKFVLEERDNFDFTDHLWKILSNCTSYQELIDPFKYIFTALSYGELQPMVHRGNNTMVAQLVRDSFSGKLRIPNLAGLYPVELLVEIGVEKLRQDYMFAFLSKDLATRENLEPFLKADGDFGAHLQRLEKMHSVIEMISMLQFFLNIPVQSLSAIAREMLHYYEKNSISENHLFKFIVPTNAVIKDLEGCPPSTWQLESAKFIESVKESTVFLLTSDPPFRHLSVSDTNMNTKEEGNETKTDETICAEKMRLYFFVKKTEGVCILV